MYFTGIDCVETNAQVMPFCVPKVLQGIGNKGE